MELHGAELEAFAVDSILEGLAEATIKGYVDQLRRYAAWCSKEGTQATTVRSAKAYLATLTQWSAFMAARSLKRYGRWLAEECGDTDPFEKLKFVRQPDQTPQRTASSDDIAALLKAIEGNDIRAIRDRALILTLATTGMRRAELCRMGWSDVDLASGSITLPKTKAGRPRTVRVSPEGSRALRRYYRALDRWDLDANRESLDECWISTSRRAPLTPNGVGSIVEDRAAAAGLDLTAHALRRGFAVNWLRSGEPQAYLQTVAGWSDGRMVSRYVHAMAGEQALEAHARIYG